MFRSCDANTVIVQLYSVPGVTIATDIICGFPTETEEVCNPLLDKVLITVCSSHSICSLFIVGFLVQYKFLFLI